MFRKVLIANRGAIACRIIRTLRRMGVRSVAVYSEADRHSRHVIEADEAVCIGPAPAAESYLRPERLLDAAARTGAEAIHPGYGFLSENARFAEACEAAGIVFIGPTPQQMRDFGLKHRARELAAASDVPLLPGTGLLESLEAAHLAAERIGYPVMLKSTAGGGGIGMQRCGDPESLREAFHSVERLAKNNFGQGGIFLEKLVDPARHIEVQIFGDGKGRVVALGERDCSVQRRNQKVIEETPAPGLSESTRERLHQAAIRLGAAVAYRSAGTVEFVYDAASGEFYFLEVNTRLQVEHGVTEEVTGVDLVEWMVRLAAGDTSMLDERPAFRGHSIQARVYAENPANGFRPCSGLLSHVEWPRDIRVETWVDNGTDVSPHYDPMLAKLIAHGATREEALDRLRAALYATRLYGIETNLAYLARVLGDPVLREGRQHTRCLEGLSFRPRSVEVLQPGTHTTVQDFPGRVGYWNVGVPPSGPMDDLAFRLANRLVGNPPGTAGLELTVSGPTLRFHADAVIALAGARMQAKLDGDSVPWWQPVRVAAGQTLTIGGLEGAGQRAYLAVRGGLDVSPYMGSRATFTLGRFGGHAGRALRAGDILHLASVEEFPSSADVQPIPETPLPAELIPAYGTHWDIAVTYGPHGAPDFFTEDDIRTFFATDWKVHYNSSRTGVRLIGPKPQWARPDGGEAGLHPSNIHDNAYAIGSIDYTGDMPVILGPDGPSLGGFVCPVTIISAELWKIGQLRPGDTLRFHLVDAEEAVARARALEETIATLRPAAPGVIASTAASRTTSCSSRSRSNQSAKPLGRTSPIIEQLSATRDRPAVCYRRAGDANLLIEYGPLVLDLELRFRVHSLMQWLEEHPLPGVQELTPGIRSLQVRYDSRVLGERELVARLVQAEDELPSIEDLRIPSRIVHLPLSWDDPATRLAIERYMRSVRADAPWCPSNIEFIRRINGLDSIEDVRRIVFEASYLVMGLGDVYLGAPVATPLDPRHRLVTTKYNPARTWTPENAVGIGGAYLCVYGMEGPGGYQFVGRTVQMWNRDRVTAEFERGRPWLLRFFDQIRFFPVSAEELLRIRDDFPHGRYRLKIEKTVLDLREYRRFLAENRESIERFKARQQAAFEAERERWRESGQFAAAPEVETETDEPKEEAAIPPGCIGVSAPVTGSIWQLGVSPGQRVAAGQELLVIEAMKMEIPLTAANDGTVVELRCARGSTISAGDTLLVIRPDA